MKAVMYGGGNIGRGFIGALFSQSGYAVTFVDVVDAVVEKLRQEGRYPIRYMSAQGNQDVMVEHVTAVHGNDQELVATAIAECDVMATAVGARILKLIVPNLVAGLRRRWALGKGPLNIIVCENLLDADKFLAGMIREQLTREECACFDEQVGLVEASIGRMVPVQTEEMKAGEFLRVCVEEYGFLPVDKAGFRGDIPRVVNMVPFEPFDFYIKRKLYIHNMGHGVCAYLGDIQGLPYIYEAIDQAEIRIMVENAMEESALALSRRYQVSLEGIRLHILDLLHRFTNRGLQDTCQRVGADPARKLSREDRLIGAALLALDQGVTPAFIAVGAGAAVYRYIREREELSQSVETAARVLGEVSHLEKGCPLFEMILEMYGLFLEQKSLTEIRRRADEKKAADLGNII
ncbi:MAG: mannitol dehydrogenase [Lachnospiraceae bacterium]|nr:mannitol dehydrogenase [Lachnospiraceae bacterium]